MPKVAEQATSFTILVAEKARFHQYAVAHTNVSSSTLALAYSNKLRANISKMFTKLQHIFENYSGGISPQGYKRKERQTTKQNNKKY